MGKETPLLNVSPLFSNNRLRAEQPFDQAYNISEFMPVGSQFRIVRFISKINEEFLPIERGSDNHPANPVLNRLVTLDHYAAVDAVQQPGSIDYKPSEIADDGWSDSYCLWENGDYSSRASSRPAHKDAVNFVIQTFLHEYPDILEAMGLEALPQLDTHVYDKYSITKIDASRPSTDSYVFNTVTEKVFTPESVIRDSMSMMQRHAA